MWKENGRDKLIDRFHTCTNIQPSIYLKFFIFRFKKWKNPIPHDTSFSFDVAVFGQKICPWYFWKVGLYVFLLVSKKMLVYVCTIWFNKVSWFYFFWVIKLFCTGSVSHGMLHAWFTVSYTHEFKAWQHENICNKVPVCGRSILSIFTMEVLLRD